MVLKHFWQKPYCNTLLRFFHLFRRRLLSAPGDLPGRGPAGALRRGVADPYKPGTPARRQAAGAKPPADTACYVRRVPPVRRAGDDPLSHCRHCPAAASGIGGA